AAGLYHGRPEECFENTVDSRIAFFPSRPVQQGEALTIDRLHLAPYDVVQELLLGTEVVMDCGHVEARVANNDAQGCSAEALLAEQAFGRIQNALLRVNHLIQTNDLIICFNRRMSRRICWHVNCIGKGDFGGLYVEPDCYMVVPSDALRGDVAHS